LDNPQGSLLQLPQRIPHYPLARPLIAEKSIDFRKHEKHFDSPLRRKRSSQKTDRLLELNRGHFETGVQQSLLIPH
jgi:hypothetical protein